MSPEIFETMPGEYATLLYPVASDPALAFIVELQLTDINKEMCDLDPDTEFFKREYRKLQMRKRVVEDFKEFLHLVRHFNLNEEN